MLSFGTGFVLGLCFRDVKSKDTTRGMFSDSGNWWEFHISNLYDDVENECVKKWAAGKGYDLQADEHIIRAAIHSYKVYAEVLAMMLEYAKKKKKEAKNDCKKEEGRCLIKMIKRYQKIYRRGMQE